MAVGVTPAAMLFFHRRDGAVRDRTRRVDYKHRWRRTRRFRPGGRHDAFQPHGADAADRHADSRRLRKDIDAFYWRRLRLGGDGHEGRRPGLPTCCAWTSTPTSSSCWPSTRTRCPPPVTTISGCCRTPARRSTSCSRNARSLPEARRPGAIKEYKDLVNPTVTVHAFYVKYLLPIWFDVQCLERAARDEGSRLDLRLRAPYEIRDVL